MSGSGIRIVYAFFGVNENGNIYVLITEYKDSEVTQPAGCLSPNSFDEFVLTLHLSIKGATLAGATLIKSFFYGSK